ncbi:signal peptide peptidase SppA [Planctomyces sp. SH-PL14]|uniref:signal peptide peptidase SppA n=1 Tax=Planctomyces sp. SH-PL14 TaxID=1632864 RepID=UPI00078DE7B6|nr:signal peptide peptidase SppA [Planctomyces sp. SH-PL14]AMV17108.1 Protease 4 [Planctomyces sp. SH-PL14]
MKSVWFGLFLVASGWVSSGGAVQAAEEAKPANIVPVFTLSGSVKETALPDDPIFGAIGTESLRSLVSRVDKAREDKSVKGVVILMSGASLGTAQLEEFRAALDRLKKDGKPVFAHSDDLKFGGFALVSGAKRVSVSPTGDVWVTGLYGEQLFLRGLLDRLGVEPDFLTCGDYKSAGEMFMRTSSSPEAKKMHDWMFDSLFERFVEMIATGRGVPAEKARNWVAQGLFSAEAAKEAGLIDAIEDRYEFSNAVRAELGGTIKFDRSYAKNKGQQIDLNNPFAALQLWAQILEGPKVKKSNKDAIAIVHVDGPIMTGKADPSSPFSAMEEGAYSETIRKALDKVAEDSKVKGVVLRVTSPGGSVVASEIILRATERVKAKKPVVVSMGDVAASGGYYVSCRSEKIYADPTTITGSIGVISGKLATAKMWSQFGINFEANKRGEKAGILSGGAKFTEVERKELQGWMDEVYGQFKKHVTDGRGDKLKKPIDEIAGGRVYTGRQALELGLVDELGGLNEAIAYVANKTGVKDYEIRSLPQSKGLFEELLGDLTGSSSKEEEKTLSIETAPRRSSFEMSLKALGPAVDGFDPARMKLIRQAIRYIDLMQQEQIMMVSPLFHMEL